MAIHKYDYGVIGNCSYIAYIDSKAAVRWLCLPRFDSSFIFGSLLDREWGGEFSIEPAENHESEQKYLPNTNILSTVFKGADGSFRVTDFAPRFIHYQRYFKPLMLVRKLEPISGQPVIQIKCEPRGDYGSIKPQIVLGSNHIRYLNLDQQVRLTTNIPLNYIVQKKEFILTGIKYLVLTHGEPLEAPLSQTVEEFLTRTRLYWENWVKTTSIPNIFQEQVIRSALVLKLHQYEDTGGIIASGTTSLPESGNSTRTWDYRYCWIRDAYYTLNAFNSIGHFEELESYFQFIYNIVSNEQSGIQPLYGLSGEKELEEKELPLSGYLGSKPVRIGNQAYKQVQNDVYGQLLISILPLFIDRRLYITRENQEMTLVHRLIDLILKKMDDPDAGLWEFREKKGRHLYTYLFHWAGGKAALRIADFHRDDALKKKAETVVKQADKRIKSCYNAKKKAYAQSIGSEVLDASALQLTNMHYLAPQSPETLLHLNALEKELIGRNGLFHRYVNDDDLGHPQTSFLICSFWYIEALARLNQTEKALGILEQVLQCSNHLGLLSEDADFQLGQWGNFPQTYSHVGLMNAVYRIASIQNRLIFEGTAG
ncbi:MAG: glycoside hydrolase family 15 protein [Spirochaetales bacterium]|nr:glycoside hydrolase family 15 protein [Spirochaetales bacterium]